MLKKASFWGVLFLFLSTLVRCTDTYDGAHILINIGEHVNITSDFALNAFLSLGCTILIFAMLPYFKVNIEKLSFDNSLCYLMLKRKYINYVYRKNYPNLLYLDIPRLNKILFKIIKSNNIVIDACDYHTRERRKLSYNDIYHYGFAFADFSDLRYPKLHTDKCRVRIFTNDSYEEIADRLDSSLVLVNKNSILFVDLMISV